MLLIIYFNKIILLFTVAQVLGNAHLYPECNTHMHMRLDEAWRQHEFNQFNQQKDGNLTTGWYRIFGQAGQRLLDINDIPKNVFNRTLVSPVLVSTYTKNLAML